MDAFTTHRTNAPSLPRHAAKTRRTLARNHNARVARRHHPSADERSAAEVLGPLVDRLLGRSHRPMPITVRFWDGSELPADDEAPVVIVRTPEAFTQVLRQPGELGLGRAWVLGQLDLEGEPDEVLQRGEQLRGRLELTRRDRAAFVRAAVRLGAPRRAALPEVESRSHGLHNRSSDRRAIQWHYDVSNEFYRQLLGPSMVYSCAYFAEPEGVDDDLDAAQVRKLDLICQKLRLQPGERLLDVGCGWGALVIHAAERYGVQAVGVTLSEAQAEFARERLAAGGLSDRVQIRLQDYRDVDDDPFDAIASVGMHEHVGEAKLSTYADQLYALLRPGGRLLNHGIVRCHDEPRSRQSFSNRYVFPDGELVRLWVVLRELESAGFEIRDVESLREHYGRTLRAWSANLADHREEAIVEIGVQRERIWRMYIAGAAVLFDTGRISVMQTLAVKPGAPHGLPPTRAHHLLARS